MAPDNDARASAGRVGADDQIDLVDGDQALVERPGSPRVSTDRRAAPIRSAAEEAVRLLICSTEISPAILWIVEVAASGPVSAERFGRFGPAGRRAEATGVAARARRG